MSPINYSLAEDFAPNKQDHEVDRYVEKSGKAFHATAKIKRLRFTLNGEMGGQIKFILGFIYFFSLIYLTIELLT